MPPRRAVCVRSQRVSLTRTIYNAKLATRRPPAPSPSTARIKIILLLMATQTRLTNNDACEAKATRHTNRNHTRAMPNPVHYKVAGARSCAPLPEMRAAPRRSRRRRRQCLCVRGCPATPPVSARPRSRASGRPSTGGAASLCPLRLPSVCRLCCARARNSTAGRSASASASRVRINAAARGCHGTAAVAATTHARACARPRPRAHIAQHRHTPPTHPPTPLHTHAAGGVPHHLHRWTMRGFGIHLLSDDPPVCMCLA